MNKPGRVIVLRLPSGAISATGADCLLTLLRDALRDACEYETDCRVPIVTAMADSARVVDLWDMVCAAEERCDFDRERAAERVVALTAALRAVLNADTLAEAHRIAGAEVFCEHGCPMTKDCPKCRQANIAMAALVHRAIAARAAREE
jgi:hypothetical protein